MAYPNQPTGATLISRVDFSTLTNAGWTLFSSRVSIISDPTAPGSPPSVAQYQYEQGFPGIGISAGNYYRSLGGVTDIFIGMFWKVSNPWHGHPQSVNKMYFVVGNGTSNMIPEMYGPPGGPYNLKLVAAWTTANAHLAASSGDAVGVRILHGNAGGSTTLNLAQWYRIELYMKHSTNATSQDGIIRAWLNGAITHDHANANFPPESWGEFQLNPTWGGGDPNVVKSQTDYFWYDEVELWTGGTGGGGTGGGGGGGGGGGAPEVLPAPTNLYPNGITIPFGATTFQWTAVGGAASYEMTVHKQGTPYEVSSYLFTGNVGAGTSKVLTTQASSTYDWWIQSKNGAGALGPTNGAGFSTTASPTPPPPDPDPPPDPPDPPPVEPPPSIPPPATTPDPVAPPSLLPTPTVLGIVGTTTVTTQSRLNPTKKEFDFYG